MLYNGYLSKILRTKGTLGIMARLALLSVSNKTHIINPARTLVEEFDFDIISSGGTAKTLKNAGIPVTKVSEYTGSPEILGGRVKTLHPRIHGGILARRDVAQDLTDLAAFIVTGKQIGRAHV